MSTVFTPRMDLRVLNSQLFEIARLRMIGGVPKKSRAGSISVQGCDAVGSLFISRKKTSEQAGEGWINKEHTCPNLLL